MAEYFSKNKSLTINVNGEYFTFKNGILRVGKDKDDFLQSSRYFKKDGHLAGKDFTLLENYKGAQTEKEGAYQTALQQRETDLRNAKKAVKAKSEELQKLNDENAQLKEELKKAKAGK